MIALDTRKDSSSDLFDSMQAPKIDSAVVVLVVHADDISPRDHSRVGDCIPYSEMREWAAINGAKLVSILSVDSGSRYPADLAFQPSTGFWRYPPSEHWEALRGKTVILAGGWRSLCVRQVFNALLERGIDVLINPAWIAADPAEWIQGGHTPWEFPSSNYSIGSVRAV